MKIWRGEKLHAKGLTQLSDYLDRQNVQEGFLLIFDHAKVKKFASEWTEVEGKRVFMVWV